MKRLLLAVVAVAPLFAADPPRFEQASVKPAECRIHSLIDPGRIALTVPLNVVLMEAFQVKADQITGPSWLSSDCFSIMATMPAGSARDQLPAMLQALLVERFNLVAHKQTSARSGYSLVVDKNGPKFKAADPDAPGALPPGSVRFGFGASVGIKGAIAMTGLARFLSTQLGAPVEDQTGLQGLYDIDLPLPPDPATDADALNIPAGTGHIFRAVRDTLGLRLEGGKLPVEMLAIDSIERVPAKN